MELITGDILFWGAGRRLGFDTLTRIFAPEDRKFRLNHLLNAFNTDYAVHVNQAVWYKSRVMLKDTWYRLRMMEPNHYRKMCAEKQRPLLAAIRLPVYDRPKARDALIGRTEAEMADPRRWRRWYDVFGIAADYVPGFAGLVRNNDTLKYCSERVRNDVRLDTKSACGPYDIEELPPSGICSPDELFQWANGVKGATVKKTYNHSQTERPI